MAETMIDLPVHLLIATMLNSEGASLSKGGEREGESDFGLRLKEQIFLFTELHMSRLPRSTFQPAATRQQEW